MKYLRNEGELLAVRGSPPVLPVRRLTQRCTLVALCVALVNTVGGCPGGEDPAPCGAVAHGTQQRRLRYEASEAPAGGACVSEEQTRTCDDGTWSQWSGSFQFDACQPGPHPCETNPCRNGGTCQRDGTQFTCDCPPEYGGQLCEGMFAPPDGFDGLHGYIHFSAGGAPAGHNLGMGFYAAVWPLVSGPIRNLQIGLPSAWILPDNRDNPDTPLCPVGTVARDNWPERGPTWGSVFQTVEGGLGYWAGNRFRYGPPKFSMNGTPQCYDYEVGSPGWPFFRSAAPLPDDRLGVAQLSNRLLIPPDGLPFQGAPAGALLGYSWMALPLTPERTAATPPTGALSWTCFLNATNFKGPIAYYVPETWSKIAALFDYPFDHGRGLDSRPGIMGGGAMEINTVPYFCGTDAAGVTYTKIPELRFPVDEQGHAILVRDVSYYSRAALYDPVLSWRTGGPAVSGRFAAAGRHRAPLSTSPPGYDQGGIPLDGIDRVVTTRIFDTYAWGVESVDVSAGSRGRFPRYFKQSGSSRVVVSEDSVPDETGLKQKIFPLAEAGGPYAATMTGAWASPGPASPEHTVVLADGSRVTYRWYRFVDQPTFQQYSFSAQHKAALQSMVEKIHAHWRIDSQYMAPPSGGSLVSLDPALIVTPPTGYTVGYVPIVVRQEIAPPNADVLGNLTLDDVTGRYERTPMENGWHGGTIVRVDDALQWKNDAGVSWPLTPRLREAELLTDERCPYHDAASGGAFVLVLKQNQLGAFLPQVTAFRFLGETYQRK